MKSSAVKRAILSVSDKSGITELARFLESQGVEILSTGGTAKHLGDAGVKVTPIASYSGAPEILGGRVKTLTPKIFGGILFDRSVEQHRKDCEANDIPPIDLVVVNLYPFEQTIAKGDVSIQEAIQQIDVGGPSMIRAAAKNHRDVVVLCDPSLYGDFIEEMTKGEISDEFRLRAAIRVFERTSQYDATIAQFLNAKSSGAPASGELPSSVDAKLTKVQDLRYGENPQQHAGFYAVSSSLFPTGGSFRQLQGKELSYNNLIDLDAAHKLAIAFDEPACAIIKHTNPCGVATAATLADAIKSAIEADPVSAFGGIIGSNRPFDGAAAEVVGSLFLEVIIAPSFDDDAKQFFAKKKNLRLVEADGLVLPVEIKTAAGGVLLQSADRISFENWKCVTKLQPAEEQMKALRFAWIVCAHVKSNAIVLTSDHQSIGVGAGQMSRVDSAKLAIMKATRETKGAVAASDAFFPFRDGLDILCDAGVTAVVQPGGSVRDEEVIAAADERGIAMLFTGERHFRH